MFERIIPYAVKKIFWGDRRKLGLAPNFDDEDWQRWTGGVSDLLYENVRHDDGSIIERIHNKCYEIAADINFEGKDVLEIGPGIIDYTQHLKSLPNKYVAAEISLGAIAYTKSSLDNTGLHPLPVIIDPKGECGLPFADNTFDYVILFNVLEHMNPLGLHLDEILRVLKPKGLVFGSIPCEGGMSWVAGRYLTTRKFVEANGVDYIKIMCWEHPNFVDQIFYELDLRFEQKVKKLFPFNWLPYDFNLIASFSYQKP